MEGCHVIRHKLSIALLLIALAAPVGALPIVVARDPDSGKWESKAAEDLAFYLGQMTTSPVPVVLGQPEGQSGHTFVVGRLALELKPELKKRLQAQAKKTPFLRSDAVVLWTDGATTYLAGNNDDSHYFAVSSYLQRQGCRWYLPTSIGECIPRHAPDLSAPLDETYSPPFEVRSYWLSWNGDRTDYENFAHRNFFNCDRTVVGSHGLENLLPDTPILNSPDTVSAIVAKLKDKHAQSQSLSLGIADGAPDSVKSDTDRRLAGGLWDKYFYQLCSSDVFLPFYNAICHELWSLHPQSQSKISFLAYTSVTLPPQRAITADPHLVAFLAPIDIDPNHGLGDPRSPERQDLLGVVKGWNRVMKGRVILYDYDQGMMVWRDIPNPSHRQFQHDVRIYRDLGILGFDTESRGAMATIFTNLFFRGQLMWNPDFDVDAELQLFFQNFYGPAAEPMSRYWTAIYNAVESTTMTEHEYPIIPALYPPTLVARLGQELDRAEALEEPYRSRLAMARAGYEVLRSYTEMVQAGAVEGDYATAVASGERGLAAREALTGMNPTFTTYKTIGESGPAWWPGEVATYRELQELTAGPKGELIAFTPLSWQFRPDPYDHGLWQEWGRGEDLSRWKRISTGLIPRAQGVVDFSNDSLDGYGWYGCELHLSKGDAAGDSHLVFPGIFNSSWLYVNGQLVDWLDLKEPWWHNSYQFRWDVDLGGALRPGSNTIVLRTKMNQHPSGLFRRPFLYRPR